MAVVAVGKVGDKPMLADNNRSKGLLVDQYVDPIDAGSRCQDAGRGSLIDMMDNRSSLLANVINFVKIAAARSSSPA